MELPTAPTESIRRLESTRVEHVVFLNRRMPGAAELLPYRTELARRYMRQVLFGSAEILSAQYAAIDNLLAANVVELRYESLDWAVQRLGRLVREGC